MQHLTSIVLLSVSNIFMYMYCTCLKLVFLISLLYFSCSIFSLIDDWFWIVLGIKCFILLPVCNILKIQEAELFDFFQSLKGVYFRCLLCVLCLTFQEAGSCVQRKMSELCFTWHCKIYVRYFISRSSGKDNRMIFFPCWMLWNHLRRTSFV